MARATRAAPFAAGFGPRAALLAAALVAGCGPEAILPGTRFPVRAPLAESMPSADVPAPQPAAQAANRAAPIALPAARANEDYGQRGGNAAHSGVSAALSAQPALVWAQDLGAGNSRRARIAASPVVAGGRVFAMDADARLAAFSLAGQALWSADLQAGFDRDGDVPGGGLAAGGGAVFATTGYGEVIALDAGTGGVLWRQRLDSPATGAPALVGDRVYAMGRDGTGWALSAASGKVVWQVPGLGDLGGMLGGAAPASDGHSVIFPLPSGTLIAVTEAAEPVWAAPITGERLGRGYTAMGDLTGDPVIAGGYVYAGTAAGRTTSIALAGGERQWTAPEGALNPPLVVGGSVFVISDENRLVRLDAGSGETVWAVDLPYYTQTKEKKRQAIHASFGPVLAGGRLVVASSDGALRLFNAADGSLTAMADLPGGAAAAPALAQGMLFVVTTRGQLLAFR